MIKKGGILLNTVLVLSVVMLLVFFIVSLGLSEYLTGDSFRRRMQVNYICNGGIEKGKAMIDKWYSEKGDYPGHNECKGLDFKDKEGPFLLTVTFSHVFEKGKFIIVIEALTTHESKNYRKQMTYNFYRN